MDQRKPLDASAVSLMVLLCLVWGVGHVAAKFAAEGISLVFQAGLRSVIATALLLAWVRWQGGVLWDRDGTLWPGVLAGLLFAAEFVFIFAGLAHTDAARMVVFVYLAPCITAFGLHFLIPQERLDLRQWIGVLVAFGGVALAFSDGFTGGRATLLGDFFGLLGALFWAVTTILIRCTRLASVSATKTLFYQLAVSGPVLLVVAWLMGETGVTKLTPAIVIAFAYQCIAVAYASFLAWFWLLRRYLAARLAVFSFLTPLFGVAAGVILLEEPLTASFAAAAVLVGLGIALVNLKRA
ncbi:MAG: DMT family transporter [Betaproteobacteria bacterium]